MAPSNVIYTYNICIQGLNTVANPEMQDALGQYWVGNAVWVRIPHKRCTSLSGIGRVTRITNPFGAGWWNPSPFKKTCSLFQECVCHSVSPLSCQRKVNSWASQDQCLQIMRLTPVFQKLLTTMLMDHLTMVLDVFCPRKRPQLPHSKRTLEKRGLHPAARFVMRTSGGVIVNRSQMMAINGKCRIL